MAIQYYMRGYNTATPGAVGYVDWVVNDTPYAAAAFVPSPYVSGNIINITVNKVVTSKVGNFLNPAAEPTFIAPNYTNPVDGYFLHLNSFDWLNPVPPTATIPPLDELIGVAVVRGVTSGTLNPYASLYWTENDGYSANGFWTFGQINFDGSTGQVQDVNMGSLQTNGPFTVIDGYIAVSETDYDDDPWANTGIIRIPNEQFIKARNFADTADVQLIGADNNINAAPVGFGRNRVVVGSGVDPVYLPGPGMAVDSSIIKTVSGSGVASAQNSNVFIKLPSGSGIVGMAFRNGDNTGDYGSIAANGAFNRLNLGDSNTNNVVFNTGSATNTTVSLASNGAILPQSIINVSATAGYAPAGTIYVSSSAGIQTISYIGITSTQFLNCSGGTGTLSTDGTIFAQVNINYTNNNNFDVFDIFLNPGNANTTLSFGAATTLPSFTQTNTITGNGQPLHLSAQSTTALGNLGGPLLLHSGVGPLADGYVDLGVRASGQTLPMIRLFPTLAMNAGSAPSDYRPYGATFTVNNASTIVFNPVVRFPDYHQTGTPSLPLSNLFGNGGNTGVAVTGPTIAQDDAAVANGLPMLISAQWTTLSNGTAGKITVQGGTATAGASAVAGTATLAGGNALAGTIGTLQPAGSPRSGGSVILAPGSGFGVAGSLTHGEIDFINDGVIRGRFYADTVNPNGFFEVSSNNSPALAGKFRVANNNLIIGARNSTAATDIGVLSTDGYNNVILGNPNVTTANPNPTTPVNVIIGGDATNVIGSPSTTLTTVAGSLLVLGSMTTVESTVVDIVGRAIHANWSTAANVAPPTLVAGYSVHRGATGAVQNDGAAIIWTEGAQTVSGSDGYWRFATLPQDADNVSIGSSPNILNIMAGSLSVASTPNPAGGTLPVVGGLRTQNNTTAVSARNAAGTTDILLLGTDGSNHILHGASGSPTNAGHIFSTTTGSVFDFWVNGVSEVQLSANAITFTGTDLTPVISQASTTSASAQSLSIEAQSSTNVSGIGGNLNLAAGIGPLADGYVQLQVGSTIASAGFNKFIFNQGRRRHVTSVTGTYSVVPSDDYIAITYLSSSFTIFLPLFPALGDVYEIKDTTGNSGSSPVTISGNGINIDANATFALNQPYASAIFTYTGTTWSIT
jgi:hypothetical protein